MFPQKMNKTFGSTSLQSCLLLLAGLTGVLQNSPDQLICSSLIGNVLTR